jgi:hypothetical protein
VAERMVSASVSPLLTGLSGIGLVGWAGWLVLSAGLH